MTPDQATELAAHTQHLWPDGPPPAKWEAELLPLDHETALEAIRRLRNDKHAIRPGLARFKAHYLACRRPDPGPPSIYDIEPDPPPWHELGVTAREWAVQQTRRRRPDPGDAA